MKNYSAPAVLTVGCVVEATKMFSIGVKDPIDDNRLTLGPAGSIGFQL
jgi:hypothetical protein